MLASASSLWYKMCTYDILTNMAAHTDEYKKKFAHCKHVLSFCSKANTIKLEKIQERALRFIYEDYKYHI